VKYKFRRRILYILLQITSKIFLFIPYCVSMWIGAFFGNMAYIFLTRYRNLTRQNLEFAFKGSIAKNRIDEISRRVFINLGISIAEVFSVSRIKEHIDKIIEFKDIEKFDNILAKGKGIISLSAHLGNWELMPMYFAGKGYPSNIIARPIYYEKYNEWASFLRSSMGVNVIYRTESPKKMIKILKDKQILGMAADQDIDSIDGVFVDFFAEKAYTPSSPVKLANVAGVPIVPMFIVRKGNKHSIYIEDPIYIENNSVQDWVVFYTQKWSNIVESYIRKYPEQWVWMHKRWKTRPGDRAGRIQD
jgi:Kdo2-lipid IVA lauroyltransferase/acyltransferase